jgi:hypothetical protein
MAEETKTYVFGNDGAGSMGNFLPGMLMGGGFGGFGFGNTIGELIGLAIVASIFGWGGNGFGGFGGNGGNGAAGFLSNQINNDAGRELIMQAITSNGEQSRQAISTLSTMLGQDFNLVNTSIQGIQGVLNNMAIQNATTPLQIINAIQNGDASLSSQFAQCCCENRLAICQQTNALQTSIAGVNENIAANRAAQQLADCQQTYALTETMNRNYSLLDNKIDAVESSRKDREITALTAKVAQLESQNFTTGVVGQAVAPINAQLAALNKEVDDIKCKLPNTINVEYPQVSVVNTTPYMGWNNGFNGWGYGFNGASYWG